MKAKWISCHMSNVREEELCGDLKPTHISDRRAIFGKFPSIKLNLRSNMVKVVPFLKTIARPRRLKLGNLRLSKVSKEPKIIRKTLVFLTFLKSLIW